MARQQAKTTLTGLFEAPPIAQYKARTELAGPAPIPAVQKRSQAGLRQEQATCGEEREQLRNKIIGALARFPEARAAVVEALEQWMKCKG